MFTFNLFAGAECSSSSSWWSRRLFQWNDWLFHTGCQTQGCPLTVEWPHCQHNKGTVSPIYHLSPAQMTLLSIIWIEYRSTFVKYKQVIAAEVSARAWKHEWRDGSERIVTHALRKRENRGGEGHGKQCSVCISEHEQGEQSLSLEQHAPLSYFSSKCQDGRTLFYNYSLAMSSWMKIKHLSKWWKH